MPELPGPPTNLPVIEQDPARILVASPQPQTEWWGFPVYMAGAWYAATVHDLTGALNVSEKFPDGYRHTGIDLNLDRRPWGDVERGVPVLSISPGVVEKLDFHKWYRGCVIVRTTHADVPLWVRYWHLARTCMDILTVGQVIEEGAYLGHIGAYDLGGDHLHLDMALDPFEPRWWHTVHGDVRWVDPVEIMRAHCTVSELEAMLRKGKPE